ncbi:peptidase A1 family protein [Abortiporus biennis]
MGCISSKLASITNPTTSSDPPAKHRTLHPLIKPKKYQSVRPSFSAAYARAVRRYGIESGKYTMFVVRRRGVSEAGQRGGGEGFVVFHKKAKATGAGGQEVLGTEAEEGEVPAEGIQNVKIGTPAVTVNLDFDTGSSDLWIWSSELAHASRYPGHHIFDPRKSSTAKKAKGTWRISYGDGSSASGDVYTEVVTVGDVTIKNQAVELASKLSSSFLSDGGNDGLLGLAWPSINTVVPESVKTPVENMIDGGLIEEPIFTVKLTRGDTPGFYSFGFIDESVTQSPLYYTDVDNSQGFWQVPSTSYAINGKTISREGNSTILDTGTTLCLVADDVVEAIYNAVEGATFDDEQGGWKYPSNAKVPAVEFAVGDQSFKINPADFGFGPADDGYIFGGIQSRGDLDFDIFGDVFLKGVYVVFNQGKKTVGLAQRDD